jgi:DNA polymerase I-like protein with 3'-5' exonuclease and polymerase domains
VIELAVDTETTGRDFFHGCKPFMVTMCDGSSNYYWTGKVNPYNRAEVRWSHDDLQEIQLRLDRADSLLFHNAKFDVRALDSIGIDAYQWHKIEDTLIASHVCCSGERHGLKQLAFKYLDYNNEGQTELQYTIQQARLENKDYDLAKKDHPTMPGEGTQKGTRWYTMDYWLCIEECKRYGIDDVEMTWLLWQMYKDVMEELDLLEVYHTRRKLLEITYDMQTEGLHIYRDEIVKNIKRQTALGKTLTQQIISECKIRNDLDFSKDADIHYFLFTVLDLPILQYSEKSGKPKLSKDVIEQYVTEYPEVTPLQHFAELRKTGTKTSYLTSYLKWADNNDKLHSDLLITGTRETRQSSRNPNTQNIDKALKHVFGPPPGYVWLVYDLVNIELRIWGYEVGNKELTDIFDQKKSFHAEICRTLYPKTYDYLLSQNLTFKKVFNDTYYQWVKNGNFSIIYGGGEKKANQTYRAQLDEYLLDTLINPDTPISQRSVRPEPVNAYRKIVDRFPEVPVFTASKIQEVHDNHSKYGFPFITCKGGYQLDVNPDQIYTTACNYFCQGSAGYIIGLSMIEVHNNPNYQRTQSQMVNQVHDSLYIQVPIEHNTPSLQLSLQESIEAGGEKLLPTCEAELEAILYHPQENPDD